MKKGVESKQWFSLTRTLKSSVIGALLKYLKNLAEKVEALVYTSEKKVIQMLYSSVLFITAIVFLSASLVFLLEQYLRKHGSE